MFNSVQIPLAATLLVLVSLCAPVSSSLLKLKAVKRTAGGSDDYDRYMLATSWAGTTCKFNDCTHYGEDNWFNSHGLWPSTANNSPQDCKTINFQEQNLSPYLKQSLYTYWNSFYHDNWEFLDHEITKHGSCWNPKFGDQRIMDPALAQVIQGYNSGDKFSEINTFLTLAVSLAKIVDPFASLKKAGIVPSDTATYKIEQVLGVFSELNGLQNSLIPVCLAEKSTGNLYLAELRFCTDLNFKPIACNLSELRNELQRCRSNDLIYPTFPRP